MQKQSFSQIIETESWDSLASMLISMPVDINKDGPKLRRIAKELEVIKHILYDHLNQMNGNNTIDMAFYVGAIKSISKLEKKLESNGVEHSQFVIFLKLLLGKLKKQKLIVKKPMEVREKFGKLKEVVEDANSL
jgi:hypothetical protein